MTREIIPILTEEQWLELRAEDITSTMSPGLLGMSPYLTSFELYHAKKSGVQVPFIENDRIQKGKRMEQYAAEEVALKMGWAVTPINDYIRIPEIRMGSTFDYEAICPERGPGILEIKAVDYFQHKEKWDDEAPGHIEVQLQHQLECADRYEWGCIVAFTGIYDFHVYDRTRDREFGAAIRRAVEKFWADVEAGNEPEPDFYRDGEVIDQLYRDQNGEVIDLTGDIGFESLVSRFDVLKRSASAMDKEIDALKNEIHLRLENNAGAYTERYKITAGRTKDSPGKLVTEDMVGTYIGARSGYRQCLVKDITEKKGK